MRIMPENVRKISAYDRAIVFMNNSETQIGMFFKTEPLAVIIALFISILITLLLLAQGWVALIFLGVNLTLAQLVSVVLAVQVAVLFPSPGGIGAVEAALIFIFTSLGYSASQAASFTLILRIHDLALGGFGLFVGGWKAMRRTNTNS